MAKLFVLEGVERCGKTSLMRMLKENNHEIVINTEEKFPQYLPEEQKKPYTLGFHDAYINIFNNSNKIYFLDRFFLSELCFSKFKKRNSYINADYIKKIVKDNLVVTFYLHNTYSDYLLRGPKNKMLTEAQYQELQFIFEKNIKWLETDFNLNFIRIDSNQKTLQEIYQIITNYIK